MTHFDTAQIANARTMSILWGIVLVAISANLIRVAIRDCVEWGSQRPFRQSFRILLWLPFFAWFWVVMSGPVLGISMDAERWIFIGPFIATVPLVLFVCGYAVILIVRSALGIDLHRISKEYVYGTIDYRNGVPRSALTIPVNWFRRHYREARLRGFDDAAREHGLNRPGFAGGSNS
jgi:hypothetical protein